MSHHLLYVIGQLRSGGSEHQLYYLLKTIDRDRYRPAVVVWNFSESDTYAPKIKRLDIPLYLLTSNFSRVQKLRFIRRIVVETQPAVVHSYSFHTNFGAFWATRGTPAIAIGAVRSDFDWAKKDTGRFLGRLNARWPRTQIFNSDAAARSALSTQSLFAPKHCWVIRNGIDLETFCSQPPSEHGRVVILGVGSLFPIKRWDRLISLGHALRKKRLKFEIRLVGEGPLRESLQEQAQRLGIADHIDFTGQQDNVAQMMADANFVVHTAEREGCPNVIMEAMACGRAVVATDVGDVGSLVEDGKTGFVVGSENDELLLKRTARLIEDQNLCCSMGKAGRAKAEREFGLDRLVSSTFAAYRAAGWQQTSRGKRVTS